MGLVCRAAMSFSEQKWPHLKGDFTVDVDVPKAAAASIAATLELKNELPERLSIAECSIILGISKDDLQFKGGISGAIAELLRGPIAAALDSEVPKIACETLSSAAVGWISALLRNESVAIEPLLGPPSPSDPPSPVRGIHEGDSLVNWTHAGWPLTVAQRLAAARAEDGAMVVDKLIGLAESKGWLNLENLEKIHADLGGVNLTMESISIKGLDAISRIEALQTLPDDDYSLHSEASLGGELQVRIGASLCSGDIINTSAMLVASVRNPRASIDASTVLDWTALGSLQLGQLLQPSCLAGSLASINTTFLDLDMAIDAPPKINVTGQGLSILLQEVISAAGSMLPTAPTIVPKLVRGMAGGPIRRYSNVAIEALLQQFRAKDCTPVPIPKRSTDTVKLNESSLVLALEGVLDLLLGIDISPIEFDINDFFSALTNGTGSVEILGTLFKVTTAASDDTQLTLKVENVIIAGLESFESLWLEAVDSRDLSFKVSASNISIGIQLYIAVSNSESDTHHEGLLNLDLDLEGLSSEADMALNIDGHSLSALFLNELPDNLHHALRSVNLAALELDARHPELRMSCSSDPCISPGFVQLVSVLQGEKAQEQISSMIRTLIGISVNSSLGEPLIKLLNNTASCFTQHPSEEACIDASRKSDPKTLPNDFGVYPVASIIIAILASCAALAGICDALLTVFSQRYAGYFTMAKVTAKEGNKEPLLEYASSLETASSFESASPPAGTVTQSEKKAVEEGVCLAKSASAPEWIRRSLPLFLLCSALLTASANIGVGASVNVDLNLGGIQVPFSDLFTFALANSVRDMYIAGVYPLASIILLFSGIWPYAKFLMMLGCWYLPPTTLAPKTREALLRWLDALGKWSLIDNNVLILMMVAFNFHVRNDVTWPGVYFLPKDFLLLDVRVTPGWGILGFIIATVILCASSHIMLAIHRSAAGSAISLGTASLDARGKRESLCRHAFWGTVRPTAFGQGLLCISICATAALTLSGAIVYSFNFRFQGLAGMFLGEDEAAKSYSLMSVADHVGSHSGFEYKSIYAVFLLFALVIPLLHLFLLLCMWTIPLTLSEQRTVFVASEVLSAWQSLDVFMLALVAALLQLRQFAAFIVGGRCNFINDFMDDYLQKIFTSPDERQCFSVVAALDDGAWQLLAAAICTILMNWLVSNLCERSLEERLGEQHSRRRESRLFHILSGLRLVRRQG
eukprot:g2292.t1